MLSGGALGECSLLKEQPARGAAHTLGRGARQHWRPPEGSAFLQYRQRPAAAPVFRIHDSFQEAVYSHSSCDEPVLGHVPRGSEGPWGPASMGQGGPFLGVGLGPPLLCGGRKPQTSLYIRPQGPRTGPATLVPKAIYLRTQFCVQGSGDRKPADRALGQGFAEGTEPVLRQGPMPCGNLGKL